MIEFLIFYWVFAALFTLGWSEIAKDFPFLKWLLIIGGGISMPIILGVTFFHFLDKD